jgi:hypothetical protein
MGNKIYRDPRRIYQYINEKRIFLYGGFDNMKQFTIKITDTDVYINDELCYFSTKMDKENAEDDLNKKALVALANEMGYEAIFLFEEMAYRLDEMLDEIE